MVLLRKTIKGLIGVPVVKNLLGYREQSLFSEQEGNPGFKFSIGKSGMRCFALWESWELQLFPENFSGKLGLGIPLSPVFKCNGKLWGYKQTVRIFLDRFSTD